MKLKCHNIFWSSAACFYKCCTFTQTLYLRIAFKNNLYCVYVFAITITDALILQHVLLFSVFLINLQNVMYFFFCEFWIDAACNAVFIYLIFHLYCAQIIKIKVKSNNMWQCCFADFFIQSSFTEINASDLLAGYCRSAVDVSYSFLL